MPKCDICGDKPRKDRAFPSAVVEINNPEQLVLLRKVQIPSSMGTEEDVPPAIGKYRNVILQYEANGHIYLYSSDGIPTFVESGIPQEILDRIASLEGDVSDVETDINLLKADLATETNARELADATLQQEIDDFKNSPDVVDIVATYAALEAYDTQHLGNNDVIRVLRDETHDGQSSYYRWDKPNSTWVFIGTVGDYYTKGQVDSLLDDKQDVLTAGTNITINANNEISATDTTYSDFVGTDGTTAGAAGLVPAPATTDAGKFLKADGTWDTAGGGGPTVVQTTGTSTTDVMSQNATTSMVYADPATKYNISISGTGNPANGGAVLLFGSSGQSNSVAIGQGANVTAVGGVALGSGSRATSTGEMNIGTQWTSNGYNNTAYRLLTGLYDGQGDHDAATYGQVISYSAINGAGAPTTATEGKYVGQLYYDTTNEAMYFLKAIDTTTTPTTYTWEALGGGSSVNVVQATGTSTTDVMSQASTSQMIFPSGFETSKDRIAVGDNAAVSAAKGIAIGQRATSSHAGSVAIGHGAITHVVGEVSINSAYNTSYGYNNTSYRLLTGLYDPQNAHDAATKGYVDTVAPTITMTTTDPGEGATLAANTFIAVYNAN